MTMMTRDARCTMTITVIVMHQRHAKSSFIFFVKGNKRIDKNLVMVRQ